MLTEFTESQIHLLGKGDPEAYRLLYRQYFAALCVFARNLGLGKEEAEDIVQDIFCHIYNEKLLPTRFGAFRTYLYTAVRNRCYNFIRDTQRRKNNEQIYHSTLDNNSFWDQIIKSEVYRELQLLLNELPEQCRNIFQRSLNGDTSEKIATDLKLSVETVKTQRKKAKKILRERIKKR